MNAAACPDRQPSPDLSWHHRLQRRQGPTIACPSARVLRRPPQLRQGSTPNSLAARAEQPGTGRTLGPPHARTLLLHQATARSCRPTAGRVPWSGGNEGVVVNLSDVPSWSLDGDELGGCPPHLLWSWVIMTGCGQLGDRAL